MSLTPKQEKFIQGIVSGKLSQREAYKQAYNTSRMKDETIDNNAYKLMQNNEVLTRYNTLMEEHKEKALWTREKSVNDLIMLKEEAWASISEKGMNQTNSNAFINAVKELNELELRDRLNEKKIEVDIKKKEAEIEFIKTRTELLKGVKKDTSLLEALIGVVKE